MLQSLREKTQGWPAKIIFGILIFVFSFFGIEGYFQSRVDTSVAKVGKEKISQQAYQHQLNRMREQLSQQQGGNYDPSYVDRPEVKQRILRGMIDRSLLRTETDKLGVVVSRQALRAKIASYGAFQVNGKFNADAYRTALASQRMTPMDFQKEVAADMQTEQLPDLIGDTSLVTKADVDGYLTLAMQTRDIHYAVLPRPALTDTKVDDKAVADYYKAHHAAFMTPEKVSISYIEVKASDIKSVATPDEATLKARYEKNKQRYIEPEQRLVSHILIKVPKNATPAQQKAALAKAEAIDKKAKSGVDFAKLAKQYSADLGSKLSGGDLGWIGRGVTNKDFEDALFALKKGQISKPILSPDGYHIIWLRDIRAGQIKPFAKVRSELAEKIEKQERERAYSELASRLTDKVYADPSALAPVAKELGLKLQHTDLFTRQGGKSGISADPKVIKSAFSDDVLKQGNSSDPIELGKNDIVVIHVDQHLTSKLKPLPQVAGEIRQDILDQRAAAAGRKQAEKLFAELKKQGDMGKVVSSQMVAVQPVKGLKRHQPGVPQPVVEQAFKMPHPVKGAKSYDMVSLGHGSFALVELDAVHAGDLSKIKPQEMQMLRAQMGRFDAVEATNEFVDVLRRQTKIEIHKEHM